MKTMLQIYKLFSHFQQSGEIFIIKAMTASFGRTKTEIVRLPAVAHKDGGNWWYKYLLVLRLRRNTNKYFF